MFPSLGFIDSYALMTALGVIAAAVVFELYFRKVLKEKGGNVFYLEVALIISLILGIFGSFLVQNLYDFIANPETYQWQWRSTFFGGFIFGVGGFILLYFLFIRKKYPDGLKKILVIAPGALSLAHAFGRIGCFLAGCCYGKESTAWYSVYFPTLGKSVIPTNLFEAIFLFILAAVLINMAIRDKTLFTVPVYAISYGLWRFLIEFLRDDDRGSWIPGISPSQFWSLLLFVGGVAILIFLLLKKKKEVAPKES